MSETKTDQESRHDHRRCRTLQGLRALHSGVPAERLVDVDRGQSHGLPLPRAASRVHRLRGVPVRVPRLRVRGLPLRNARGQRGSGMSATTSERVLDGGFGSIGAGRDRVGLPVLRGLSDDPVHRGARALRRAAAAGRRRVHQRRIRARGRRHGVGRARDRRPGRDRIDRARALADAGVVLRDDAGRAPTRHLQHGARTAGLLPGNARWWSRRLPPHRARAAGRTRRRRARAARVSSRRQVAQSGAHLRRLSPRAYTRGARDRSDRILRAAREGLGGRRLSIGHRQEPRRHVARREQGRSARDGPRGQGAVHRHEDSVDGTRGTRRVGRVRRRRDHRRGVRRAGEVREVRDQCAARSRSPHRIRTPDHLVAVPVRCRRRSRKRSAMCAGSAASSCRPGR